MSKSTDKATYMGTLPLDFLRLPGTVSGWQTYQTEDIFAANFINFPHNYLYTMGSGVDMSYRNLYSSLATTPAFQLPTSSQFYVAGRDVIRWGGTSDPTELDFDRYGFTPDFNKGVAVVWKAPKSEPHHLSQVPAMINNAPKDWIDLVNAIKNGTFS